MTHRRLLHMNTPLLAMLVVAAGCASAGHPAGHPRPVVSLSDCGPAPSAGPVFLEPQLSQLPRLLQAGPLTYPAELRAQGLPGAVRVAFVIDTLGRAVPSSLRTHSAGNIAFEESARETILRSRWLPGVAQGQPAAVCTIVTIHFSPN